MGRSHAVDLAGKAESRTEGRKRERREFSLVHALEVEAHFRALFLFLEPSASSAPLRFRYRVVVALSQQYGQEVADLSILPDGPRQSDNRTCPLLLIIHAPVPV